MRVLAHAVIQAITFLSLSDDTIVQPDAAVKVLEDIAHTLRASTHDEIAALQSIIQEEQEQEMSRLGSSLGLPSSRSGAFRVLPQQRYTPAQTVQQRVRHIGQPLLWSWPAQTANLRQMYEAVSRRAMQAPLRLSGSSCSLNDLYDETP